MKVTDSRLQKIMPKQNKPKNNVYRKLALLIAEAQAAKTQDLRLTFYPGLIGIAWRGNIVTQVLANSQAASAGVSEGWKVLAVNGKPMPDDGIIISKSIRDTKDAGKNTLLLFAPSTLRPGTEVILHNLKRNARLNGYSAKITKAYGNNKYDVALLDTKTRTGIRGIIGDYLQMKHQEQFWNVISPGGVKIHASKDLKSQGLGYLRYDSVIHGINTGDWVKHSQGYSRLNDGEVQFLAQDATRRFGVVWALAYKRKELHFQPCRAYEQKRRNLQEAIEAADKRQQELEEADMKMDDRFTPDQWRTFWKSQNKFFGRYYNFLSHHENKVAEAEQQQQDDVGFDDFFSQRIAPHGDQFPEQIEIPKAHYEEPPTEVPQMNIFENEFDALDMITARTSQQDIFSAAFSSGGLSEPTNDPFAESDPFAAPDPFAESNSKPSTNGKHKLISS